MSFALSEDRKKILENLKKALNELEEISIKIGLENLAKEIYLVKEEIYQPFTILIVGEYNRGKSSLINALLKEKNFLEEGPIPTTSTITIINYGNTVRKFTEGEIVKITHTAEWLKDIVLVDTPGVNSVIKEHEKVTLDFVHKADLVFFVLSVDQPLSYSEVEFLRTIKNYRAKIVVILNKIDLLEDKEEDLQKQENFLISEFMRNIGFRPEIIRFSAKLAKIEDSIGKSGLRNLEDFVKNRLSEKEKFRIKIEKPVQKAIDVIIKCRENIDENMELISQLLESYSEFNKDIKELEDYVNNKLNNSLSDIEKVIDNLINRTEKFIDKEVNFLNLVKSKLPFYEKDLYKRFENEVLKDVREEINEVIDNFLKKIEKENDELYKDTHEFIENNLRKCEVFVNKSYKGNIYTRKIKSVLEDGLDRLKKAQSISFEERMKKLHENISISLIESLSYAGLGGTIGAGITGATATVIIPPIPDLIVLPASILFSTVTTTIFIRKSRNNIKNKIEKELTDVKDRIKNSLERVVKYQVNYTINDISEILDKVFADIKDKQKVYQHHIEKLNKVNKEIEDILNQI